MEYPHQMQNEGPTAMEVALVIAVILGQLYGAYKLVTYAPVTIASVQAGTETAVRESLGVATIASMLK